MKTFFKKIYFCFFLLFSEFLNSMGYDKNLETIEISQLNAVLQILSSCPMSNSFLNEIIFYLGDKADSFIDIKEHVYRICSYYNNSLNYNLRINYDSFFLKEDIFYLSRMLNTFEQYNNGDIRILLFNLFTSLRLINMPYKKYMDSKNILLNRLPVRISWKRLPNKYGTYLFAYVAKVGNLFYSFIKDEQGFFRIQKLNNSSDIDINFYPFNEEDIVCFFYNNNKQMSKVILRSNFIKNINCLLEARLC